MNRRIINKSKAMLLSSLLALGMMLPSGVAAQQTGGLFEHQDFGNGPDGDFIHQGFGNGLMGDFTHQAFGSSFNGDFTHQIFGSDFNGDFTHQGFGQDVPLGSGLFVLTTAGIVFAFRRKKEEKD